MARSGDSLIAVNGRTVSSLAHNEVVRLISSSQSSVVVQIAENYATDSSSGDEGERSRPKFPHRRYLDDSVPKVKYSMFGRSAKREQQSQRELWLLNNQARGRELGERLAGRELGEGLADGELGGRVAGRELGERVAGQQSPRGQSPGARSAGGDRWGVTLYLLKQH